MQISGKRLLAVLVLIGTTGVWAQDGHAHDTTGDHTGHGMAPAEQVNQKTVTGEVIDIACFVRMAASGPKHKKCALYCADLGMPIGILEDGTGTIYVVLPEGHAAPKDAVQGFIGSRVTAKLKIFESGGLHSAEVMEIAAAPAAEG